VLAAHPIERDENVPFGTVKVTLEPEHPALEKDLDLIKAFLHPGHSIWAIASSTTLSALFKAPVSAVASAKNAFQVSILALPPSLPKPLCRP
jgi:hypothetical protein